jgi:ABC-type phosphate/phosphonate transport system substrate-binding protein
MQDVVAQDLREPSKQTSPFRVGFSSRMFSGINAREARAAIKVWADSLTQSRGIDVIAETEIHENLNMLKQALADQAVDMVALRIDEYLAMNTELSEGDIYFGTRNGIVTEKYVLLSHQSSDGLSHLGQKLVVLMGPRTGMSLLWLDTALIEEGLKPSSQYFSEIREVTKVSQAILPVFFGQASACLVNQSGYEAMVELNPQVGKELKTVLISPHLLPSLVFFRPGFNPEIKKGIRQAILELHHDAYGKQILMLFKLDRIVPFERIYMRDARALFETRQKIIGSISGDGKLKDNPSGK